MEKANIVLAALIIVACLVLIVICIIQGGKIEAIRKAYDELSVQYTEALKDAREENELLKKQITHDPMTPVRITEQRLKVKEIKKNSNYWFNAVRTNRILSPRRGFNGSCSVYKNYTKTEQSNSDSNVAYSRK